MEEVKLSICRACGGGALQPETGPVTATVYSWTKVYRDALMGTWLTTPVWIALAQIDQERPVLRLATFWEGPEEPVIGESGGVYAGPSGSLTFRAIP